MRLASPASGPVILMISLGQDCTHCRHRRQRSMNWASSTTPGGRRRVVATARRGNPTARSLAGLPVCGLAHDHAIDLQGEFVSAGDHPVAVPFVIPDLLQQCLGVPDRSDLLLAVLVDDRLLASHGHAAARVLEEATGPLVAIFHVGLVTGGVPTREFAAAELNAGVASDELVLEA